MTQMENNNSLIHGIIFDLDGTLIRSVVNFPKMKRRMIEYIQKLNIINPNYNTQQTTNEIILDLNDKLITHGLSLNERENILAELSGILTEVEFENIHKVELLPGVFEFLNECTKQKIKTGILTRASKKYTEACVTQTNIKNLFNTIASRDDFTLLRAKPHPEALSYIIKHLEVKPENILFVGDHHIDFTCAKEGEIRFVGVLAGAYDPKRLLKLGCYKLVKDFYELSKFVRMINKIS